MIFAANGLIIIILAQLRVCFATTEELQSCCAIVAIAPPSVHALWTGRKYTSRNILQIAVPNAILDTNLNH